MDLVCLVLSHQPAENLCRLERLARDKRFLHQRSRILHYRAKSDLIKSTSEAGEVTLKSGSYVSSIRLLARALFLRDVSTALHLYDVVGKIDFWSGIATGIPEIQAKVLFKAIQVRAGKSKQIKRDKILEHCNDLLAIPWTPQLETIMRTLVPEKYQTRGIDIYGFLRCPLDSPFKMSWGYYTGLCLQKLRGKETFEEDPELQVAISHVANAYMLGNCGDENTREIFIRESIRSGYLFPIKEEFTLPVLDSSVLKYAVKFISLLCLQEIVKHHLGRLMSMYDSPPPFVARLLTTRRWQERATVVLDDPDVAECLPCGVSKLYNLIAYRSLSDCIDSNILISMGIEPPTEAGDSPFFKIRSLQGLRLQDPLYLYNSNKWEIAGPILSDLYRRGQWHREIEADVIVIKPIESDPTVEKKILAYLKGKCDDWN